MKVHQKEEEIEKKSFIWVESSQPVLSKRLELLQLQSFSL